MKNAPKGINSSKHLAVRPIFVAFKNSPRVILKNWLQACMKWEVPYVLVLLLIFNILAIYPSADFDFILDANGVKHYTLTPEISDYDNPLDDLTNVLFIRYGNPWNINADNNFETFSFNQNENDSIFAHNLNNQLEKSSTSIERT